MNMIRVLLCALAILSAVVAQKDLHYVPGHDGMVHLFEWKWGKIAEECENFLGPMGFGGVQVSPIQENVIVENRPWWERYQPISYKWHTRSGTAEEFKDMVRRCNNAGVRIYVDVVFNHMTGNHQKAKGTGGSTADTNSLNYPGVPYSGFDFHVPCTIDNYNDAGNVRNCELSGLHDLNQSKEYVRNTIVNFLNETIDAGVAGYRVDAAKHMWPEDLKVIYSRVKNLNPKHNFPSGARPYVFQEVIDYGSEAISKYEYNSFGAVTEFRYGMELSNALNGKNQLKWFANWGEAWGLLPSQDAVVFIDNHDTQRGHPEILTYKSSKKYKMAVAFMLAHNYGTARIMSSFAFDSFDANPPQDSAGNLISPTINSDNTCGNGWICEHRWRQIYNMVRFRIAANNTDVNNWWDNGKNQIAFSRGNAGFIAINGDEHEPLKKHLFTSLQPGTYCDVISGNLEDNKCTGKTVTVDQNGKAYIEILPGEEDGVIAIHRQAKIECRC
ncbi:PREDICTED: alpha-amylase-like [Trachymyrmex septentrionalis]|uniref:alpha-amylase-like n=1 Tax=Trachymyrmex septentrionalis TaxID=34720 RepID=UPI00084F4AE0|nr:PREDICTED: alpha-amylase-like [Trachymyrmex septentrionalis]